MKTKGITLWNKAKKIIPGGTQLLSKRSEMFLPEHWPSYFSKAKGIEVWDLDNKKYLDMTLMGIGSCTLGYSDKDVNQAVKKVIETGTITTLNSPEEVELAEMLLKIHPWAEAVRYSRTGGEAMAIAVRIARAHTGGEKIAFCGYHGWHDWYLATNLTNKANLNEHLLEGLDPQGVPKSLTGTSLPFQYNKIDQLEKIVKKHKLGVIVVEPIRHQEPKDGFLEKIRTIADEQNAVLIFDEVTSGWRLRIGGKHLDYKVNPDIAVFGKSMSNGFPMAAIIGTNKVMDAAQTSFISSTYWTDRVGPAASIATIKKFQKYNVPKYLDKIGKMIGNGWKKLADQHGINVEIQGPNCMITYSLKYPNAQEIRTLFTQEMLKRGYLATPTVYVSYSHKKEHVDKYLTEVDDVFKIISKAIEQNNVKKMLKGPVAHSGFQRLT